MKLNTALFTVILSSGLVFSSVVNAEDTKAAETKTIAKIYKSADAKSADEDHEHGDCEECKGKKSKKSCKHCQMKHRHSNEKADPSGADASE